MLLSIAIILYAYPFVQHQHFCATLTSVSAFIIILSSLWIDDNVVKWVNSMSFNCFS